MKLNPFSGLYWMEILALIMGIKKEKQTQKANTLK